MDTVRLGLVGCGGMGRALAVRGSELDNVVVTAVADPAEANCEAAAEQFQAAGVDHYEKLISRDDVDAVVVATPGGLHRPVVEAAAAAGKPIFCEKPLATNTTDADAMVRAVNEAGVTAMVGQVVRFHPTHKYLKQMTTEGPLGEVISMYVERLGDGWGDNHPAWRLSRAQSGGIILEVNAHEIDFMLWLAGPVTSVYAIGRRALDARLDYPDIAHVSLTFAGGAVGVLQSSNIATLGSYAGRFDCHNGSAVVSQLFGGAITWLPRDGGDKQEVSPEEMKGEDPVRAEMRAFVDSVVNGTPPAVPFEQARDVVAVGQAVYDSIDSGEPVRL